MLLLGVLVPTAVIGANVLEIENIVIIRVANNYHIV